MNARNEARGNWVMPDGKTPMQIMSLLLSIAKLKPQKHLARNRKGTIDFPKIKPPFGGAVFLAPTVPTQLGESGSPSKTLLQQMEIGPHHNRIALLRSIARIVIYPIG